MTAAFFNLTVNSIFSLFAGLIVVHLLLWLFRVPAGPTKLFLLSLPFVKIVYDFARGLPENSVLYSGVDIFSLPSKHQCLTIDGAWDKWGPAVKLQFSVKDLGGKMHAESLGDYLLLWIRRDFGHELPLLLLAVVLSVSATLLAIRFVQGLRFERERRMDRATATTIRTIPLLYREVDVYESSHFAGTPFTGGLLKPYICIPASARAQLSPQELEAVIAHELGHVRQLDLPTTVTIQVLGDLFWFVPGYRFLARKIDRLREIVADQWAVRSGAEPALLASALLKLKEIPAPDRFVLYSAFFREKSLLRTRVERLLGETTEPKPRLGWQIRWVRYLMLFWISTAVLTATFGGNHPDREIKNYHWVEELLKKYTFTVGE